MLTSTTRPPASSARYSSCKLMRALLVRGCRCHRARDEAGQRIEHAGRPSVVGYQYARPRAGRDGTVSRCEEPGGCVSRSPVAATSVRRSREPSLSAGHKVLLIERQRTHYRPELVPDADWMLADACELASLQAAGIHTADVVIAATGDDAANLVFALLCKTEFGVARVVARVNNPDNQWLFTSLGGRRRGVHAEHSRHRGRAGRQFRATRPADGAATRSGQPRRNHPERDVHPRRPAARTSSTCRPTPPCSPSRVAIRQSSLRPI